MAQSDDDKRSLFSTILIVMVVQIGGLTLFVVLASLFGGLWLDGLFGTKPLFTLILLLAGIPLSVVLMLILTRKAIARIKTLPDKKKELS
jgi:F0F1-type ATP synthase assembly protein I